jgi:hypothetical protein
MFRYIDYILPNKRMAVKNAIKKWKGMVVVYSWN